MNIFYLFLVLIPLSLFSKELIHTRETPKGISIFYTIDDLDNLTKIHTNDSSINYELKYDGEGGQVVIDHVNQTSLERHVDYQGRILKEIFPSGHEIEIFYRNSKIERVRISELGEIAYEYEGNDLVNIHRISPDGKILYTHSYQKEGEFGSKETLIGKLGIVVQNYFPKQKKAEIKSPFGDLMYEFDANDNVVLKSDGKNCKYYHYDQNSLIEEDVGSFASWDCIYDESGNLVSKMTSQGIQQLVYDPFNRLIRVIIDQCKVEFTYDVFGRRMSKTVTKEGVQDKETYLYIGNNEIATCHADGSLKCLRIPGLSFNPFIVKTIAMETSSYVFAPIYDINCNIMKLINIDTKEAIDFSDLTPFGDNLFQHDQTFPWIFSAKHYDREINLVYFGHRYYDPSLRQWISPDPLSTSESSDPYLYCFNNPYKFIDPDGRFAFAIPLIWTGGVVLVDLLFDAVIAAGVSWGAIEVGKAYYKWKDKNKEPPYNGKDLGSNSKQCPGKGFEWKGDKDGQWYHEGKEHSLRPDFNHPGDVKPHWDYLGPEGGARLNLDGTWEPKK